MLVILTVEQKATADSQEGLDIQTSVADLPHHMVPAAWVGPGSARPGPSVPGSSGRAPPDPPQPPAVSPAAGPRVELAQALGGGRGVVGARRGLVGEGLLEALLAHQGPGTAHSRGGDVLQRGGRGQGGVPETERQNTQ